MSKEKNSNEQDNPESQEAEIKQEITHDFVLDIYERALQEEDEASREAILATAAVLSKNIGEYLVDIKK